MSILINRSFASSVIPLRQLPLPPRFISGTDLLVQLGALQEDKVAARARLDSYTEHVDRIMVSMFVAQDIAEVLRDRSPLLRDFQSSAKHLDSDFRIDL